MRVYGSISNTALVYIHAHTCDVMPDYSVNIYRLLWWAQFLFFLYPKAQRRLATWESMFFSMYATALKFPDRRTRDQVLHRVKLITIDLFLCTYSSCRWWNAHIHTHTLARWTHKQWPKSSANHESHYPNIVIMPWLQAFPVENCKNAFQRIGNNQETVFFLKVEGCYTSRAL